MEKWKGKVAVVTGAGAGIGAAIASQLVNHGVVVVGVDINKDKVEALANALSKAPGKLHSVEANLREEKEILAMFDWVEEKLGGADILVNNAGVLSISQMIDGDTENWRAVLEVNVLAVSICTREYLKSMEKRGNQHGHIIMINSVAAHTAQYGRGGMYYGSKHAVKAIAMCLRKELADKNSTIKVTCISPGRTRTEITGAQEADSVVAMEASDVAEAVIAALSASSVTQMCEIIMTPVPTKFTIY